MTNRIQFENTIYETTTTTTTTMSPVYPYEPVFRNAFERFGHITVIDHIHHYYKQLKPNIERDAISVIGSLLESENYERMSLPDLTIFVQHVTITVREWLNEGRIIVGIDLPEYISRDEHPGTSSYEYYDTLYRAYATFGHDDVTRALSEHYANITTYHDAYIQRIVHMMRNPVYVPETSKPVEEMMNTLERWLSAREMQPDPFWRLNRE